MAGNGGIIGPVNTVTASQAEAVTTFNASATFTTQPRTITADYLVVAGGGAGGGITINVSAPLVDETIIDTILPSIRRAQQMELA